MKISKIAKILPIALAFTMCTSFAAEDQNKSSSVDYTLTLHDYIKISVEDSTVTSNAEYGADYGNIKMSTPLATTFKVISNAESRQLLLTGTCNPSNENAIRHVSDTTFELVFSNSTKSPTAEAIQNITSGTGVAADSNANAIAFLVTLDPAREQGPDIATAIKTTEWDGDKEGIVYTVQNGHLTLGYTISQDNVANTFNTQDMDGTYTAKLTLTDLTSP